MGNAPQCNSRQTNKLGYIAPSRFLLTVHFYELAFRAVFVLSSCINGFSRLWRRKNGTISLQDISKGKFVQVRAYLDKESTFEKSKFKIIGITHSLRIEASKEVIIMNRDCKVTYPFSNAKSILRRAQRDVLKDIHFIFPVVRDGTQKSACNVI